ncbi:MAG: CoA transferase [Chloroflexi bacterium]|nr:CoA transferase [Chloroflexota bacterium]MBV9132068.1 CoA transferase [Chloroflexota bacterium]MBV9899260.1 CoA transferase [Chloroflexota bacterium]
MPEPDRALSHIKVIDLCRARSGPTCVRQLSEMGAQVIKVEALVSDDDGTGVRHSFDFQNVHPNKRSLTLNLKHPEGRDILLRMVPEADVVVENFRPDVKFRLGIDYETLSKLNPRLVYGSISGFGQTGPYRDRPGLDQIAQGLSGLMTVNGEPGRGPMRVGLPVADLTAGFMLAHGIVCALLERERSGRGQWVHTSLLQANIRLMEFQAARYLIAGEVPGQAGNYHPISEPTGVYRASDGSLIIQAGGQTMFRRLCEALEAPELAADPRFVDGKTRLKHRPELTIEIEKCLASRTSDEWVQRLREFGVPAGLVLNVEQCFDNEQVKTLPMVWEVDHPSLGKEKLLGPGVQMERTPPRICSPAPEHGQHTDEVLTELGFSAAEIARLHKEEVV